MAYNISSYIDDIDGYQTDVVTEHFTTGVDLVDKNDDLTKFGWLMDTILCTEKNIYHLATKVVPFAFEHIVIPIELTNLYAKMVVVIRMLFSLADILETDKNNVNCVAMLRDFTDALDGTKFVLMCKVDAKLAENICLARINQQ